MSLVAGPHDVINARIKELRERREHDEVEAWTKEAAETLFELTAHWPLKDLLGDYGYALVRPLVERAHELGLLKDNSQDGE